MHFLEPLNVSMLVYMSARTRKVRARDCRSLCAIVTAAVIELHKSLSHIRGDRGRSRERNFNATQPWLWLWLECVWVAWARSALCPDWGLYSCGSGAQRAANANMEAAREQKGRKRQNRLQRARRPRVHADEAKFRPLATHTDSVCQTHLHPLVG
jgi:hypothetical protein